MQIPFLLAFVAKTILVVACGCCWILMQIPFLLAFVAKTILVVA